MTEIRYLLSEQFPYEKTIAADAGPSYARRQAWTTHPLSELRALVPHGPVVVDNRATESEMAEVVRGATALPCHPIYVKVVDPHWECIRQPYYQWLLKLSRLSNVCFVGPYQPTRFTQMLSELSHAEAYLNIPYGYESAKELPLALPARRKFLVFSGATHAEYYPERAALLNALRRHWWSARAVTILPHPGYPDVGQAARHNITGDHYLTFLAAHRFMYLEPSRDGLEFLKYSECAYAGCVPTGRPASTLPTAARTALTPLESSSLKHDLRRLANLPIDECQHLAETYRECFRRERAPAALNRALIEHWQRQSDRLATDNR